MKWIIVFLALVAVALGQTTGSSNITVTDKTNTTDNSTTSAPAADNSTTSAADNSTTLAPTNSSSAQPTTQAPSSEAPKVTTTAPPTQNFVVKNGSNVTCLEANLIFKLKIPYNTSSGSNEVTLSFNMTNGNDDHSTCDGADGTEVLQINLNGVNATVKMSFSLKETKTYLSAINLTYTIDPVNFPNATNKGSQIHLSSSLDKYDVTRGNSYKCMKPDTINVEDVTLTIEQIQVEAFKSTNTTGFSQAEDCEVGGDVSDIVPIAVGCALAGLVLIVLVAYLVGRRRSRQKGYQSV